MLVNNLGQDSVRHLGRLLRLAYVRYTAKVPVSIEIMVEHQLGSHVPIEAHLCEDGFQRL